MTGWHLTGANGISADGRTIVGNGTGPGGTKQSFIARLPMPVPVAKAVPHDFNGDGRSDVLLRHAGNGGVGMWLMNGAAVATSTGVGIVPLAWQIVGQRDFDGAARAMFSCVVPAAGWRSG